ncbi:hypothetical protein OSB04_023265 [Centaurea solstitialis]|uniref:Reverse transcriptase Ty1/copia-type domain-containing protein n=1 Tax=Centaurea solstitialis TaxID=347529 RepID=A0AA38SRC4_9ASTR|nr:hypothetical protein OSB04_023265 [Centaurea solstitialis]
MGELRSEFGSQEGGLNFDLTWVNFDLNLGLKTWMNSAAVVVAFWWWWFGDGGGFGGGGCSGGVLMVVVAAVVVVVVGVVMLVMTVVVGLKVVVAALVVVGVEVHRKSGYPILRKNYPNPGDNIYRAKCFLIKEATNKKKDFYPGIRAITREPFIGRRHTLQRNFSPVARLEEIPHFLVYTAQKDFKVFQHDVKSVFLNGKLSEEFYVAQPPRFPDLKHLDYRGKIDNTLFLRKVKGHVILLQIYVDDIVFGSTKPSIKQSERIFSSYKNGTPNLGLWYPKDSRSNLSAYSDRDFAGCKLDRKSTTDGCQLLGGKLLSKIPIYFDNTLAIAIAYNLVLHSKTKHIKIIYHFIRDHVMNDIPHLPEPRSCKSTASEGPSRRNDNESKLQIWSMGFSLAKMKEELKG